MVSQLVYTVQVEDPKPEVYIYTSLFKIPWFSFDLVAIIVRPHVDVPLTASQVASPPKNEHQGALGTKVKEHTQSVWNQRVRVF